jgi:prevent-host-death family protein
MEKFTVEEFQSDFDNLMERVEQGESFIITSEYGDAVMVPYDETIKEVVRIHTELNNDAS